MAIGTRVAIAGVGYSTVGRNTGLSSEELTIQATNAALEDSGLTVHDIDGITSVGTEPLQDGWMLGIEPLKWWASGMMVPAFAFSAAQAIAAVAAGFCHTVLALRVIKQQPSAQAMAAGTAARDNPMVALQLGGALGDRQWLAPFGAGSPTQWAGLLTRRHMEEFGTTEEQFGHHIIAQRYHASLNDDAIFRDPLTMDEYLASRYVSKPLRILDCDYPVDSGAAVIFTTEDRARDLHQPVVLVEASAITSIRDLNFEILEDMARTAPAEAARQLWSRTDLKPTDVDTAHLYDGFSVITFQWLEALGFCPPGQAGPFVEAGNTRLGGSLPVNTDGGACNVGRRHGANFCIEATRQLRGQCGERQVDGAEVSVFTTAVGPFAAAFLLTKG
ncbi:MAG TPA: thiolase family protein [Acidimicrobiia bacterium]|nr:thiolase family protein [Acidimicrobiia bacterium]